MQAFFLFGICSICLPAFLYAQAPVKRVLLEQYTGAWCGWCVDGSVVMEDLMERYPDQVIGLKIHQGDAMEIPKVMKDTLGSFVSGYPAGSIDRVLFSGQSKIGVSRNLWSTFVMQQMAKPADVDVKVININYDPSTRKITADVEATFVKSLSGDIRLNLIVAEDSVIGTGSTYDQRNFISNNSSFVGHPYYSKPDPIKSYAHRAVVRAYLGGAWGVKGIVPGVITPGTPYKTTFSYTVPSSYKAENITLVATVQKYGTATNQKEILNAAEAGLTRSIVKSQTAVANPYMSVPKGGSSSTPVTISNLSAVAGKVKLEIDMESSYLPEGWSATLEPSEVDLPANGTATANVKLNTNNKQGYAIIQVKSKSTGNNVISRASKAIAYNVTPGMKYAVFGGHERLGVNYTAPLTYMGDNFDANTIVLPIDADLAKAYPPSQYDLAIIAVDFGSRGSLGLNSDFMSAIDKMLTDGKKVLIASGLEAYFGISQGSASTKSFFQNKLGLSLVGTQPTARFTTDANGNISSITPFQLNGVAGDYIGDGISIMLNQDVEPSYMPFIYYTDILKINTGSKSVPAFYFDGDESNIGGIRWEDGNSRLVLFTFDLDGTNDLVMNGKIMRRSINWLLNGATSVQENQAATNETLSLSISPNPASDMAMLNYSIRGNSGQYIRISVVDAMGREMAQVFSGEQQPGSYQASFNAAQLPAGAYRMIMRSMGGNGVQLPLMITR
jgi:hypothetical protein